MKRGLLVESVRIFTKWTLACTGNFLSLLPLLDFNSDADGDDVDDAAGRG